jgi:DNA-binding NarL/FixJ family response regulator
VVILDAGSARGPLGAHVQRLRVQYREARPLILAKGESDEALCQYLRYGARGFVSYDHIEKELPPAVETVSAGGLWVSRRAMAAFAEDLSRLPENKKGGRQTFTARERVMLECLAQGLCNKEISAAVGISEPTVKFHLKNIFRKLGVHDRRAVVGLATSSHGA